jgi:hypothetical protein
MIIPLESVHCKKLTRYRLFPSQGSFKSRETAPDFQSEPYEGKK